MTIFLLYLWLKLDSLSILFVVLAIALAGIPALVFAVNKDTATTSYNPKEERDAAAIVANRWFKLWKKTGALALSFVIIAIALPTQKQGAYLIAGYAGLKLAETPEMGKLTELVRLKVGNYLDDELKDARAQAAAAVASAVH